MTSLRSLKLANHAAAAILGLGFIAIGAWNRGDANWLRSQVGVAAACLILLPGAAALFNRLILPACARRKLFLPPAFAFVAVYIYLVFFAYNLVNELGGATLGYRSSVEFWLLEPIRTALWGVGALIPIWLFFGFGLGFVFRRFADPAFNSAKRRGRSSDSLPIDRLSLLKQVNYFAAFFPVALVWFSWFMALPAPSALMMVLRSGAFFALTLAPAVWALNRWCLPAAARRRRLVFAGFLFQLIFLYLFCAGAFLANNLRAVANPVESFFGFAILLSPYALPIVLPIYLSFSLALGGALSFLYRRRDYLPEVL